MKLDVTKLPMGGATIGFLLAALIVTFVGAFIATEGEGEGGELVEGSPTSAASPSPQVSPPAGGGTVAISMGDNFFDAKEFTVAAGSSVTVELANIGVAIHNMRIAGPDGSYNTDDDAVSDPALVMAGGTATLTWQAPDQPGQILFQCDFHAPAMAGTITVQ